MKIIKSNKIYTEWSIYYNHPVNILLRHILHVKQRSWRESIRCKETVCEI